MHVLGWLMGVAAVAPSATGCGNFTIVSSSCFPGGTYTHIDGATTPSECCNACLKQPQCTHWTFDSSRSDACNLKVGAPGNPLSSPNCTSGTLPPAPQPPRPPAPSPPSPPNPDATKPHIVFVLADDLGFYDTQIYNPSSPTPVLKALSDEGIRLDHHYVFRYCSPTRRSFLSGRFPNLITTVQPDGGAMCSNFLPLAFTILPQKLKSAGYATHMVGKGHEGYQTVDHLPYNRGWDSHVGYLSGGPLSYFWGNGAQNPLEGRHDMWEDLHPGIDVVPQIFYSANFYAERSVAIIENHAASNPPKTPFFLYLPIQSVHAPYQTPPGWETFSYPAMWDETYANMLHMLDVAVGNVTTALKAEKMWESTLFVFTADNGGIGRGNNHPLRGHKHDPWEGGTRSTAFVSGGVVPASLRGSTSGTSLIHVADWYATFCRQAGVDPKDSAYVNGAYRDINSVDIWPMLTKVNATQPRLVTPTTEASIIKAATAAAGAGSTRAAMWKLVTLAGQSNFYLPNGTNVAGQDPCLAAHQVDPPQPPGRTDPLVNGGCAVCNATRPCLYDLMADPEERSNLAAAHPDIIAELAPILSRYNDHYVTGSLPAEELAANYTELANRTVTWKGYYGPCYIRKAKREL